MKSLGKVPRPGGWLCEAIKKAVAWLYKSPKTFELWIEIQAVRMQPLSDVSSPGGRVWRGSSRTKSSGTLLVVLRLRLQAFKAGGLGPIPGQGTRSHMPHLRVWMLQLKILSTATKTWCSRINKYSERKKLNSYTSGAFELVLSFALCLVSFSLLRFLFICPLLRESILEPLT